VTTGRASATVNLGFWFYERALLRAIPLLLNETRTQKGHAADGMPDEIFDSAEDHKVIDSILNRLRQSDRESPGMVPSTQPMDQAEPDEIPRSPQAPK